MENLEPGAHGRNLRPGRRQATRSGRKVRAGSGARPARHRDGLGVIDIGSNSIRLVVYDRLARALQPVFNEKVLCGLGRGLARTGYLHEEGRRLAIDNLVRFKALAEAMEVGRLKVLATAAVREAKDGPEFVELVERRTGFSVEVLSGGDEARLSAMGVLSAMPGADGLMGDLGGGSLEVVALDHGHLGHHRTLPLGPLRLKELPDLGRKALREAIDKRLAELPWLAEVKDRDFHAVGGAWRALARIHMGQSDYPIQVIHNYVLARDKAVDFLDLIAGMSRSSLEQMAQVQRKRLDTLPLAALVLQRLLLRAQPRRLIFSALGLREGSLFAELPPAERRRDPLIEGARQMAERSARFVLDGGHLASWIEPLFANRVRPDAAAAKRLRLAACFLGDIAWNEHPDSRAEIAFLRILRSQLIGLDHADRAFLALAAHARYGGSLDDVDAQAVAQRLLTEEAAAEAMLVGRSLRLAFGLSGGAPSVLKRISLRLEAQSLCLVVPRSRASLIGEMVTRRFEGLASTMGRRSRIEIGRTR